MLRLTGLLVAVVLLFAVAPRAHADERGGPALAPSDLFASISPAVAFIQTPVASGSGVLIDSETLITNAHVAWPFETVRVRFPDGTDFANVPVVAWDRLADLAVVRIPPVAITPVPVADPTRLSVGSEVFLIGYPGEIEANPQPTIMRGLVSRFRSGGPAKVTYVETDAPAVPGNSGGAMVSSTGDFVGIPEFRFRDTTFTLAASATDAVRRVQALLRREDPDGMGDRRLSALAGPGPGQTSVSYALENVYVEQAFLLRATKRGLVDVEVNNELSTLVAYAPTGLTAARSIFPGAGKRSMTFLAEAGQPYVIVAGQASLARTDYTLTASEPVLRLEDPDKGRVLTVGQQIAGDVQFYGDHNYYYVDLVAGQTITASVSSVLIDAVLLIDRTDNAGAALARDDDSGGGLLGRDPRLSYTAPKSGRYVIALADVIDNGQGGYSIGVYNSAPPATTVGAKTIVRGKLGRDAADLFVFGGGTNDDLVAAARCPRLSLRLWAIAPAGELVPYIPGATNPQVNARWDAIYPFGVPANTPLLGWCLSD